MATFNLKIVTPFGMHYEGPAEAITVRAVTGDISIWANHIDIVTALGIGKATITANGEKKIAACSGGVLSAIKGEVTVLASTFEWADEIDLERAQSALEKGKEELKSAKDQKDVELARLKIKRALMRESVKKEH